jgi:6-phosphogluconate dehydrogenase
MRNNMAAQIGIIGIGVMGRNLALNIADKGYSVIGYDKDSDKIHLLNQQGHPRAKAASSLKEVISSLQKPRISILLVPAGPAVDAAIQELLPLLAHGDIIIDGGNSHFTDTNHRQKILRDKGFQLLGMGISGGEVGARFGPSLMPGGPQEAYQKVKPILEAAAARVDGQPCVAYLGPGSSGHYVKMVHNGIEYGMMQMIAETYEILKNGLNFDDDELHHIYQRWNEGRLQSFLIEITAQIFSQKDEEGKRLIDVILDVAKQKGTGMWTSQNAMELQVPVPTIDMAVSMRDLSVFKHRWKLNQHQQKLKGAIPSFSANREVFLTQLENALYMGFILAYEQGMSLLSIASQNYQYHLDLEKVAAIWRGGCIIRSALLEKIRQAYQQEPHLETLLKDRALDRELSNVQKDMRAVVMAATQERIPVPGLMASLSYYDAFRGSWLPTNLIQAQRDYFGAHTYERIDKPGVFHTEWQPKIDQGHPYHD